MMRTPNRSTDEETPMRNAFIFSLALTLMSAGIATAPATAADDMMMKIDCTKAGSLLSDATKMGTTSALSGDTDKDFMAIAMEREKGTNQLMKVEAACGKDAKMKAMAAKEASDPDARLAMFRNQGMSQ